MKMLSFKPGLSLKGRKLHPVRGFDGKPFHPPLTDIPVGAYVIAPVLDIAAYLFRGSAWSSGLHEAARWVFMVGAFFALLAVITGVADWLTTEKGTQIRRMANAHALTMFTTSALVATSLILRTGDAFPGPHAIYAALGAVILLLVTIGGTLGGSMVFEYGFNVQNSKDHPVYHPSETDLVHGEPKAASLKIPETEQVQKE